MTGGDASREAGRTAAPDDPEDVRRDDEPAFEEPWQARAFAVAVQLTERGEGDLPWESFQERLVEEIEADGEAAEGDAAATEEVYYEQWLRALERLLVEEGFLSEDELADRAREFESGERDASEFVIGEHGHSHEHGHGHDHHEHAHSHDQHEHEHREHSHGDGHHHEH